MGERPIPLPLARPLKPSGEPKPQRGILLQFPARRRPAVAADEPEAA